MLTCPKNMPAFWPFLPHLPSEWKGTVDKVASLGKDITDLVDPNHQSGGAAWTLLNHSSFESLSKSLKWRALPQLSLAIFCSCFVRWTFFLTKSNPITPETCRLRKRIGRETYRSVGLLLCTEKAVSMLCLSCAGYCLSQASLLIATRWQKTNLQWKTVKKKWRIAVPLLIWGPSSNWA